MDSLSFSWRITIIHVIDSVYFEKDNEKDVNHNMSIDEMMSLVPTKETLPADGKDNFSESAARLMAQAIPFLQMQMEYRCALMEIETKLRVLNQEFNTTFNRNPFESIQTRIKSPASIVEKLKRKGFPVTAESADINLNDIAGIRVICSFPDDIYTLADLLSRQDDIVLIERKDYIKTPKPNGYRSLHLVVEIPIFLATGTKKKRVEVQFRTIAMDFWASLEHKVKYKRNVENAEKIGQELKECADIIAEVDNRMMAIRNEIYRDQHHS